LQRGGAKEAGTVVLVEPRKHKALGFVVKNLMENLGPEWSLVLFHGTANKEWLEEKLQKELSMYKDRITLHNLMVENVSYPDGYNTLLTSREFHEKIPTELFLVAQTDSMICPQHKNLLDNFIQYDYVGGPWNGGFDIDIGNGGFSLRRKSKMLEILDKYPVRPPNEYEDYYYGKRILDLNGKVPSKEEAKLFSQEEISSPKSFGVHKFWSKGIHVSEEQCRGVGELQSLQGVE